MNSSVNIEIISRFELFLTIITVKCDGKMLPLNMLVHVSGFVAGISTVRARPALFTTWVSNFDHLVLHNTVQVCAHKNLMQLKARKIV